MLSPQHPRVLLALAEPPQLCNPFPWELELPGLAHLPRFILCPPSPQGSEFVPSCGSWAEAGARGQPLSVPPEKRAAWSSRDSCWDYVPCHRCPRRLPSHPPLALTGGRQAALFGVSYVPLPLTL